MRDFQLLMAVSALISMACLLASVWMDDEGGAT